MLFALVGSAATGDFRARRNVAERHWQPSPFAGFGPGDAASGLMEGTSWTTTRSGYRAIRDRRAFPRPGSRTACSPTRNAGMSSFAFRVLAARAAAAPGAAFRIGPRATFATRSGSMIVSRLGDASCGLESADRARSLRVRPLGGHSPGASERRVRDFVRGASASDAREGSRESVADLTGFGDDRP